MDVQPRRVCRHEGQVLSAEWQELIPTPSRPARCRPSPADGVNHYSQAITHDHQHYGGSKGAAAHIRSGRLGIPDAGRRWESRWKVIGYNAKLLRDQAGNKHVLHHELDHAGPRRVAGRHSRCLQPRAMQPHVHGEFPKGTYYLYTPNLDHLSNDAENFGGLMTEVHII